MGGSRARWLASLPPRCGVRWFAPGTSLFGAVRPAEVGSGAVSAGGIAAGIEVGAVDSVPDPGRDPRPPARPASGSVGRSPAYCALRSLALLSRSPTAGVPGTPWGLRLGKRALRARLRSPRHVFGQRRQWPLPFAPPGLEQRLPAAGEGAAGPGEGRGGGSPPVRGGGGCRGSFHFPEPVSSPFSSELRGALPFCSRGAIIIVL